MKILFHFDTTEALAAKAKRMAAPFEVACCPESSDDDFDAEIGRTEVLWHSLKPVTAQVMARAIDDRGLVSWSVELPPLGRRAVTLEYRIRSQRGVAGV